MKFLKLLDVLFKRQNQDEIAEIVPITIAPKTQKIPSIVPEFELNARCRPLKAGLTDRNRALFETRRNPKRLLSAHVESIDGNMKRNSRERRPFGRAL